MLARGDSTQLVRAGFIYVLSNPSMPGIVKIGLTRRDPRVRAHELSSPTGVPTPFKIEYVQHVNDCRQVERALHRNLHDKRVDRGREFFEVSKKEAVKRVKRAVQDHESKTGNGAKSTWLSLIPFGWLGLVGLVLLALLNLKLALAVGIGSWLWQRGGWLRFVGVIITIMILIQ